MSGTNEVNINLTVNAACKKIRHQFPKSPEGMLMFAVIATAIRDASGKTGIGSKQAISFLSGDMPQAELCGVNSEWITEILIKMGLLK